MNLAGTGHRPNKLGKPGTSGYSSDIERAMSHSITDALTNSGVRISQLDSVISGMALGFDTALAQWALDQGVPLIAAVPFEGQESRWPKSSQDRFHSILDRATQVVHVCEPGYAAWKMQQRNMWMVDRADVVLALWNGTPGGTANCVNYAEKRGKKMLHSWPYFVEHRHAI